MYVMIDRPVTLWHSYSWVLGVLGMEMNAAPSTKSAGVHFLMWGLRLM